MTSSSSISWFKRLRRNQLWVSYSSSFLSGRGMEGGAGYIASANWEIRLSCCSYGNKRKSWLQSRNFLISLIKSGVQAVVVVLYLQHQNIANGRTSCGSDKARAALRDNAGQSRLNENLWIRDSVQYTCSLAEIAGQSTWSAYLTSSSSVQLKLKSEDIFIHIKCSRRAVSLSSDIRSKAIIKQSSATPFRNHAAKLRLFAAKSVQDREEILLKYHFL